MILEVVGWRNGTLKRQGIGLGVHKWGQSWGQSLKDILLSADKKPKPSPSFIRPVCLDVLQN
jgi:hypothetical protein